MTVARPGSRDPSAGSDADVGPTVARELVRSRLKALREASELSSATVAEHTGWSTSKLNRIENGEVTVQPFELRALLSYYGVAEGEVATLARLSRVSRARQWYSKHRLEGDFQRFVAYEYEASVINIWQILFFPGLLQTEEYARAITALSMRRSPDHEDVLSRVKLRMDRQQEFRERLTRPHPPRIVAVIDESVLHRPVGGPDCLRRQIDHVLDLAERQPEVYTIAVTPMDLAHHSGLGGTFELLQFDTPGHDDVLYVEAAAGASSLQMSPVEDSLFRAIMQDLLTYGRTGDEAIEMIRNARTTLPPP